MAASRITETREVLSSPSSISAPCLNQASQGSVGPAFEHRQGWRCHSLFQTSNQLHSKPLLLVLALHRDEDNWSPSSLVPSMEISGPFQPCVGHFKVQTHVGSSS